MVDEATKKCRKLQLEVDEKTEIINVLRDELESTKELHDKFQKENIQLLKDSKRVKFLQDENDFLQDKLANLETLELEIKKLKESLAEVDFLKLRITELEEDKVKAQEEIGSLEERCKSINGNLNRIPELEAELNKWKTFSQELELEKNSIQSKLLESIEQEAKLNLTNKQIDDEVKRLRQLVKSLEEQRVEDEASNSLIMNTSDLKQLDLQTSSSSQKLDSSHESFDSKTNQRHSDEEIAKIKSELSQQIKLEYDEENDILKTKLTQQEAKYNHLLICNQTISDELESNKKLISELRQDLACEKSLASKLSKQLTNFTKQIKNLDKHYFPMHESSVVTINPNDKESSPSKSVTSSPTVGHDSGFQSINHDFNHVSPNSTTTASTAAKSSQIVNKSKPFVEAASMKLPCSLRSDSLNGIVKVQQKSNQSTTIEGSGTSNSASKTSLGSLETPTQIMEQQQHLTRDNNQVPTIITSDEHEKVNPLSTFSTSSPPTVDNGSPKNKLEALSSKADSLSTSAASSLKKGDKNVDDKIPSGGMKIASHNNSIIDTSVNRNPVDKKRDDCNDDDDDELDNLVTVALTKRAPTPVKSTKTTTSQHFVRNSMPSRSVNYGASKSSYLDRIRASVTATTTANTRTSFNQQTSSQQEHRHQPILNCMLNHQHSQRCYIEASHIQQHQLVNGTNGGHIPAQVPIHSSRQLNALIDPVSNEQLMINMLHNQNSQHPSENSIGRIHNHHHNPSHAHLDRSELTEQQIAHLANLHQQYYYHQLQHMQHMHHQLHQLHQHHLHHQFHHHHHRMHHKYEQQSVDPDDNHQQQQPKQISRGSGNQPTKNQTVLIKPQTSEAIYSGGSQFYAPAAHLDQVYANMTANNQTNEHKQQQSHKSKLVNGASDPGESRISPIKRHQNNVTPTAETRSSPQRVTHHILPQIDEINGLPIIESNQMAPTFSKMTNQESRLKGMSSVKPANKSNHLVMTPEATTKGTTHKNINSSGSANSPSPTSSTSSNLSASSGSSSGTSLNSFTGMPINRTPLRHTTTELGRRQYCVERELKGATPMTATLSRVGSCRGSANNDHILGRLSEDNSGSLRNNNTDRHSVTPSMISTCSKSFTSTSQQQTSHKINHTLESNRRSSLQCAGGVKAPDVTDKLSNNLANIKLDDKLAFTSLSAHKNEKNLIINNNNNNSTSFCVKQQQHQQTTSNRVYSHSVTNSPSGNKNNVGQPTKLTSSAKKTNDGSGNKSSVWFEYGCV